MIRLSVNYSPLQRAAFRAIVRGAVVPPQISSGHYQVTPQNIPPFLAAVKRGDPAGLCFKFVLNENKGALLFEGSSTMQLGHAQHNELANNVWGPYGYRFYDVKGGFVHAVYDQKEEGFSLVFYGFSSTFTANEGGGDVDKDFYVRNDGGQWLTANAARRFKQLAREVSVISENEGHSLVNYKDPETGEDVYGHLVKLRLKAAPFLEED
jgi:hypothetical protein